MGCINFVGSSDWVFSSHQQDEFLNPGKHHVCRHEKKLTLMVVVLGRVEVVEVSASMSTRSLAQNFEAQSLVEIH
eukprot:m.169486 g.169486  ORF g.169486 m.169486 type:complete len:75 (+) comp31574_c0_seq2:101-325(+)